MLKIIKQHDQRDCGAACLAMLAAYYGLYYPMTKFRELTKTDRTGTTLYGLVDGAQQLHMEAEALSGTPEELIKSLSSGEIRLPAIAHIVSDGAMLHFVVVFSIDEKKGTLLIGDPARGKYRLRMESFFEMWTGYMVSAAPAPGFQKGKRGKSGIRRFFALLQGQYKKLAGAFALSLIVAAIGISGAFVFELVMNDFEVENASVELLEDEHEHEHEHEHELVYVEEGAIITALENAVTWLAKKAETSNFQMIFFSLIGLYILQALIQIARAYLIMSVSKKVDIRLSLHYYAHIVDLPVSSLALRQTGEYLSRFSDASTIRTAISGASMTLLLDSVMAIACGLILYSQSDRLFFIALLMVLLYTGIVLLYRKPVEKNNRDVMEKNAMLQSYFKESIDGMETVKAAEAEREVKEKTEKRFYALINAVVKNSMVSASQDIFADTVELIGTVVILWCGFGMVLHSQISIGTLLTFYALLVYFIEPIKNLIELQPTIQTALVAADRLNDILDLEREKTEVCEQQLPAVREWTMSHVDFRYGNRELTLADVSLCVKRGEKVGIVGESGSGKTTLAKLILRFYEPEQGMLFADGRPLQSLALSELRNSIAYVSQNTFLFSDTVRNNLCLGRENVSKEELIKACKASRADEFISQLPWGYDTPVEEEGADLSGGQRQRLAIARALLKKPQLLILDEATSHLDTVTESGIKHTLLDVSDELACMIIAHRLTTVKNCDRIYVLEKGRIAEVGTHEELLRLGGVYARMWNVQ